MKTLLFSAFVASLCAACAAPHNHHCHQPAAQESDAEPKAPVIIPHAELTSMGNNGNTLKGILTPAVGGGHVEVWESSVAPGGRTPRHQHTSPEVFIVLEGSGELIVGEKSYAFAAPCTVYAPANVPHEIHNTGTTPTRQIVIIEAHSHITDMDGKEMTLPWRKAPRGVR